MEVVQIWNCVYSLTELWWHCMILEHIKVIHCAVKCIESYLIAHAYLFEQSYFTVFMNSTILLNKPLTFAMQLFLILTIRFLMLAIHYKYIVTKKLANTIRHVVFTWSFPI